MKYFSAFRRVVSTAIAAGAGSLGYWSVHSMGLWPLVAAVFSFGFGLVLGELVSNRMLQSKFVRRRVASNDFIEGLYVLRTYSREGGGNQDENQRSENPLTEIGLLNLYLDVRENEYKASTLRLDQNRNPYTTNSEFVHISKNGATTGYYNFFRLSYNDKFIRHGICHGEFIRCPVSGEITGFEAHIFTASNAALHQRANKLSESEVAAAKTKHGENWQFEIIRLHQSADESQVKGVVGTS